MSRRAHVIGAGLAGLAAAVRLAGRGWRVELSDGAAQAGGRCRSYFDPQLGLTIDNGNHLVLSGNRAVHDYLGAIGALDRLSGPEEAQFAFADLETGARWTVRPNAGPLAWWILTPSRRVAGTKAADYLSLATLALGRRGEPLKVGAGPLWRGLMEPFLVAALNTRPEEADAGLAAAVIRETLMRGGAAYRPRVAEPTLAAAFVEPALAYLAGRGAVVRTGRRLRKLVVEGDRVTCLLFPDAEVEVKPAEPVVVALPAWAAQELVPGVSAPTEHRAIVNAHFRLPAPADAPPILGLVGGMAEWVFGFADRISTTTSAADAIVDRDRAELAQALWADVVQAYRLPGDTPTPPWQVVKEKRATFAATPAQDALRPPAATALANLWLAGDWTQTGLPATIEGALRSGFKAADLAMGAAVR